MSARLVILFIVLAFALTGDAQLSGKETNYSLAFASFAPINTDIFIAEADGSDPHVLVPGPSSDYNASFSPDDKWVVFTSDRNGSADIYRVHPDGSKLERLTDDPAFDDQATISPDGRSMAFVSSRSGQADVWIMDISSRKVRNITNNPAGDFRPSWSPDGKWIAFSSDRDSTKPKGNGGFETAHSTEIYICRPDGSGLKRITRAGKLSGSPSWSADGNTLAYYQAEIAEVNNITSVRRVRAITQIISVGLTNGRSKTLTAGAGEKWSPRWTGSARIGYYAGGPEGGIEFTDGTKGARGEFRSPDWSRGERRLVFHRETDQAWPPFQKWHSQDPQFSLLRTGIFPSYSPAGDRFVTNDQTAGALHNSILVFDADGTNTSTLFTDKDKSSLAPVWSPKGDKIAFAIGHFFQTMLGPAAADIAVVNADGTGLRILTKGDGNYGFPSWSPDGGRLVFRGSSKDKGGLFIIDTETGGTKVLTTENHDNFPTWSPDGDVIAFTSFRDGDYEIYSIRPDGSDLKRLTNSPGNDAHSSWSFDGKWIAFASGRGGFKDEAALHPYNPQPYGEICVMRADGSDVRVLTDDQFEEATPNWIPMRRH